MQALHDYWPGNSFASNMEWSAATAEATQALGLVIKVTQGHEQGVCKHVRLGVGWNLSEGSTTELSIQVYIIQVCKVESSL